MHLLLPTILLLPLVSAATLTSLTSSGTDSFISTTTTTPTTLLTKTVTKTVTCVVGYYFGTSTHSRDNQW